LPHEAVLHQEVQQNPILHHGVAVILQVVLIVLVALVEVLVLAQDHQVLEDNNFTYH